MAEDDNLTVPPEREPTDLLSVVDTEAEMQTPLTDQEQKAELAAQGALQAWSRDRRGDGATPLTLY